MGRRGVSDIEMGRGRAAIGGSAAVGQGFGGIWGDLGRVGAPPQKHAAATAYLARRRDHPAAHRVALRAPPRVGVALLDGRGGAPQLRGGHRRHPAAARPLLRRGGGRRGGGLVRVRVRVVRVWRVVRMRRVRRHWYTVRQRRRRQQHVTRKRRRRAAAAAAAAAASGGAATAVLTAAAAETAGAAAAAAAAAQQAAAAAAANARARSHVGRLSAERGGRALARRPHRRGRSALSSAAVALWIGARLALDLAQLLGERLHLRRERRAEPQQPRRQRVGVGHAKRRRRPGCGSKRRGGGHFGGGGVGAARTGRSGCVGRRRQRRRRRAADAERHLGEAGRAPALDELLLPGEEPFEWARVPVEELEVAARPDRGHDVAASRHPRTGGYAEQSCFFKFH